MDEKDNLNNTIPASSLIKTLAQQNQDNVSKAREFLSHIIAEFDDNSRNRENIVALGKLFEACFLSACEWKDQQYSEIIKEERRNAEKKFKGYLEKKEQELIFSKSWADGLRLGFLHEIIADLEANMNKLWEEKK